MIIAHVDNDGLILGFYDSEKDENIPEPNHEIDNERWQNHISGILSKWNGAGWEDYTYNRFSTWTLEEAQASKYNESENYAQSLIDAAMANPQQGVTANAQIYKHRLNTRVQDKANKQAGDIVLTQAEKDQAKIDQKLSEYEGKCWDASDKAIKEIDKGTTVDEVMAIDIPTITVWPIWSPPV